MAPTQDIRWVATLSDGATVTEHEGNFTVRPGDKSPWRRLCEWTAERGLHLTSVRIQVGGQTVHLPRLNNRFCGSVPYRYSMACRRLDSLRVEAGGRADGKVEMEDFHLDFAAHFKGFSVHVLVDLNRNAWVEVLPDEAMCAAPGPLALRWQSDTAPAGSRAAGLEVGA
jgi:hypothetical protein